MGMKIEWVPVVYAPPCPCYMRWWRRTQIATPLRQPALTGAAGESTEEVTAQTRHGSGQGAATDFESGSPWESLGSAGHLSRSVRDDRQSRPATASAAHAAETP